MMAEDQDFEFALSSGDADFEFSSPKKTTTSKSNLKLRSPISGVAGAASRPEDLPGFIGNVINAVGGGIPREAVNNPARLSMSGLPGVNFATGANVPSDVLNLGLDIADKIPGVDISARVPRPYETEQEVYPSPVSAEGQLLGLGIELATPIAGGMRAARPIPKFRTAEQIGQEIDELAAAGKANQKFLGMREKEGVAAVENSTNSVIDTINTNLKSLASQFEAKSREAVLQTRSKATNYIKGMNDYFAPRFESVVGDVEIPYEVADDIIAKVESRIPHVTESDKSFLTSLRKRFSSDAPETLTPEFETAMTEFGPITRTIVKTPEEKLINAQKLMNEFTPGKFKSSGFSTTDFIKGQLKDALIDFLAEQGHTGVQQLRAEYGQFAKFRNTIYDIIQPYAKGGEYDTKKAVKVLRDLVANKNPDAQAFFQEYSKIDSALTGLVQEHANQVSSLNAAKSQAALRGSQEIQKIERKIAEKRFEIAEKADDKIQRLTKEMQTAQSAEARAKAAQELKKFVSSRIGTAVAFGVGTALGGTYAARTFARSILPPSSSSE